FSNSRGEGFENALAEMVARDLGRPLVYFWWPQRRGFARQTLRSGRCDLVMGVPSSYALALTTAPYYRSTYVFVTRRDRSLGIRSFDDPRLARLRIGVHVVGGADSGMPPGLALAERGIVRNVVGYSLLGDYAKPNPPAELIDAVSRGDVDVAIAWGPLAGYFAKRSAVALEIVPVSPAIDLPFRPYVFDIAMAVDRGNTPLRDEIDAFIERRRDGIRRVLESYGVPLVE
ncbi:MAG TPA: quinoprotein dehydrogenase-associated putative ABC transporter substrate-binding protein, partial [Thermoanaerobaculia bacterium]|nr:quinoprotein dehydrogenase-associated putative ABC transporter substrate-binding protein [Thermoanaerobaculia bacterium]